MFRIIMLLMLAVSFSGCAGLMVTAEEQASFEGERPDGFWQGLVFDVTENPFAWGSVEPNLHHKAMAVNFGDEGRLIAMNAKIRALSGQDNPNSQAHADLFMELLNAEAGLSGQKVYSCQSQQNNNCQVSVLVTNERGDQWVVDNGAVLDEGLAIQGVASYREYRWFAVDRHWIGEKGLAEMHKQGYVIAER